MSRGCGNGGWLEGDFVRFRALSRITCASVCVDSSAGSRRAACRGSSVAQRPLLCGGAAEGDDGRRKPEGGDEREGSREETERVSKVELGAEGYILEPRARVRDRGRGESLQPRALGRGFQAWSREENELGWERGFRVLPSAFEERDFCGSDSGCSASSRRAVCSLK